MTLVNPFIGEHPNRLIKWSNNKLEKTRDIVYPKDPNDPKNRGFKHLVEGRWYTLISGGTLAAECAVNIVSIPFFLITAPFVRAPAACCPKIKNVDIQDCIKNTQNWSAKRILLLAVRVLAVALAAMVTLTVGVLLSASLAIKFQEFLQILKREKKK